MDTIVENYLKRYSVSKSTHHFLNQDQRMLVGGQWVSVAERDGHDVHEFSTGGVITQIPRGTAQDVDLAVKAARYQLEEGEWSQYTPLERERLIHRLADVVEAHLEELAEIESIDTGKSVVFAREVDVQGAIDTFRYFAGWASKIHGRTVTPSSLSGEYLAYTTREPIGVVGSIIPWNFPLQTLVWKLAATLATGCTSVIKPAELTSLSALRLAELLAVAGIPEGVVNIVTGEGATVGQALASHPGVDKVTFTGSTSVGKLVGAATLDNMTRATLELGGKSPVLVMEDANLKQAAEAVANGVFFNSGQICDAGSRAYIHKSVYREFLDELAAYANTLNVAPGLDPECYIGPQVGRAQYERVISYISKGLEEGAELVCGGVPKAGNGIFVEPTVFANCTNDMIIMQEEIFGPVLATASFDTDEEAITLANDSIYGLSSAIYCNDLSRVHKLIPKIRAGTVSVNAQGLLDPAIPFGGYKQSGIGKDLGAEQLDYFLETKSVLIALS